MSNYFENIFSKFQRGFRQGLSAQYCLISTTEKWKKFVDNGKIFAALLTDLSKAFDCLPHDLIIAKRNAYGFSLSVTRLMQSYLCNRKQIIKINNAYSSKEEILFGVPPRFILGPLLFNILICDLFLIMNKVDFTSYADDNTPLRYRKWCKRGHKFFKRSTRQIILLVGKQSNKSESSQVSFTKK